MNYADVIKGAFVSRPNRFIANVEVDGHIHVVHVKNTGRCKELLIPGATVYLERNDKASRKTKFSLVAVEKGDLLINMDSQAPNKIWREAMEKGILPAGLDALTLIKPEAAYGSSRLDFYVEGSTAGEPCKAYMEVKGVTLEEMGIAKFPDAPTERGIKHINELAEAVSRGYLAYIIFIIQMRGVKSFTPNDATHLAFGNALRDGEKRGVKILAYDCVVTPGDVVIGDEIDVVLT